ncbi:transpeptidase family protein [bacterium]|nr:transpeptidase family protein [bacterium]
MASKVKNNAIFDRIFHKRGNFITFLLLLFISAILIRLFKIQISDSDYYKNLALDQTFHNVKIKPERGLICDRNEKILAMNIITYHIGARFKDITDPETSFSILGTLFNKPVAHYRNIFKNKDSFYYLEKDVPLSEASQLLDRQRGRKVRGKIYKELNGLKFDKITRRQYPFNEAAGQLIGFIGNEQFGLSGIEKSCEDLLAGKPGSRWDMNDKFGQILLSSQNNLIPPENGANINLSLDINYQIILEEEIRNAVNRTGAHSGMGIIMNPNTGQVLAMASLPTFDPNNYKDHSVSRQKIRALTDIYEPGSVFKIIPISSAIENKILTAESMINCENGKWKIYDQTLHDHHANEWLTVQDIMVHSSNIGTAKIAEKLGNDLLYKSIKQFGIGEFKDISLTGNSTGHIKYPDKWGLITNSQVSIGQSVTTTLLEIASAYSVIANGGRLLKPSIIHSYNLNNQKKTIFKEPVVVRRVITPETAKIMRNMLELVVKEGTGKAAHIPGYRVAGKTGTAQKVINGRYSDYDYYSTFAGFFPANNPVILCAIAIDNPKYGKHTASVAAAPAVKNVFVRILNSTDFRKLYDWVTDEAVIANAIPVKRKESESVSLSSISEDKGNLFDINIPKKDPISYKSELIMPDFTGLSTKYALYILNEFRVKVEIHGEKGKVKAQEPKAGERLEPDSMCKLYVD